ncbi:MAG: hypothetical protein WD696_18365 [Bryobacteraceae bacterium]
MRVDENSPSSSTGVAAARHSEVVSRYQSSHGFTGSGGDEVSLSAVTETLLRVLDAESARRSARVKELASLYQAGLYEPDSGAVTRELVNEAVSEAAA